MSTKLVSIAPGGVRLLTPDGKPFFAVIVNYVGHSDRAWAQFPSEQFDPSLIEADFSLARRHGANTIRTFVASPLQDEFPRGDWRKLDALVAAAEKAGVYLLLTCADYNLAYVQTMAAHVGMIAARYAGNPTILGYDLKNEPRFYNLAVLRYPGLAPLLEPELGSRYPSGRTSAEELAWARSEGQAPNWFNDEQALAYARAYFAWSAFLQAAGRWISARNYTVTAIDYMYSADARPWQPFLDILNRTLTAWLSPQITAIRAADPHRLITVGWNDPVLAGLPANDQLDFLSFHRFPQNSVTWLKYHLAMASSLRAAFPGKAVLLTEFGFATSEVEPAQAAIAESAAWLRAYELGLAGAGKWVLWDLPPGPNPRERSFGLFTADGAPKPSAHALEPLSAWLAPSRSPRGHLTLAANEEADIDYRFWDEGLLFDSGTDRVGDAVATWQGEGRAQLFVNWLQPGVVSVRATAPGLVTLDLGAMLGLSALEDYRLESDGRPVPHTRRKTKLSFYVNESQPVTCRLSFTAVDAQIAIVWPHDNAPVALATRANITAYVTCGGARWTVPCDFSAEVTLWQARNNEPAEPVAVGVRRLANFDGRQVPVWDFNDIDVSAAQDPATKLYFSARVAGLPCRSNVWVHGLDARTIMPLPYQANGQLAVPGGVTPAAVDARLQILWPHDDAPVERATLANLSADLFWHGTSKLLLPRRDGTAIWPAAVWLLGAIDNGVGERIARGLLRIDENGAAHWDFNDVDVSVARNPKRKLHFWIEVEGTRTYSNFWTHGADARTYLPNPQAPLGDCDA